MSQNVLRITFLVAVACYTPLAILTSSEVGDSDPN
jgi:hypothetical protein